MPLLDFQAIISSKCCHNIVMAVHPYPVPSTDKFNNTTYRFMFRYAHTNTGKLISRIVYNIHNYC